MYIAYHFGNESTMQVTNPYYRICDFRFILEQ